MNRLSSSLKLAVIGAGPKAVALAVKRHVLRKVGFQVPDLLVVEEKNLAAAWSGKHGFTDGKQPLGTPPEKDVGFPYDSHWLLQGKDYSAGVNGATFDISWHRHRITTERGSFARWVDRSRPAPTHAELAEYLSATLEATSQHEKPPGQILNRSRVVQIDLDGSQWVLHLTRDKRPQEPVSADGLVVTGPGPAKKLPTQPPFHPRIMDGRDFWFRQGQMDRKELKDVVVVGSGETAAAIISALVRDLTPEQSIRLIAGPVYSRGEGYHENRVFTDPDADNWTELSFEDRQTFVRHTDRSVFSQQTVGLLRSHAHANFSWGAGHVIDVTPEDAQVRLTVKYRGLRNLSCDYLIVCVGFDPLWFRALMTERAGKALDEAVGKPWEPRDGTEDELKRRREYHRALETRIARDLSVEGLPARLHLPMLAGLAQGPGFPNLSCLARMSDRILFPYTDADVEVGNTVQYALSGSLLGSDIWIVDNGTDKVYQYVTAAPASGNSTAANVPSLAAQDAAVATQRFDNGLLLRAFGNNENTVMRRSPEIQGVSSALL
jgi:mycobactin lysine-N-oxygenase